MLNRRDVQSQCKQLHEEMNEIRVSFYFLKRKNNNVLAFEMWSTKTCGQHIVRPCLVYILYKILAVEVEKSS